MADSHQTLTALRAKLTHIHHLKDAAALLSWDQETYMPPGGGEARADQIATLQTLAHQQFVSPDIADWLEEFIDPTTGQEHRHLASLDDSTRAFLRETWRDFSKAQKLPSEFVNRLERECSLAQQVWVEARKRNDFAAFLPHLRTIVDLKLEEVQYRGFSDSPYNALLDTYEPGATVAQLQPLFSTLRSGLTTLLEHIKHAPRQPDDRLFHQVYDHDNQLAFSKLVLTRMGYDFHRGRLDLSAHPFTTSFHPTDVRITTRVFENDLPSCLFSSIHEGGHGLYDQGLPREHYGNPLGESISLGIHESQSRLWENCVGRSLPFWRYFFPLLQEHFPRQLKNVTLDQFYAAINSVKPSLIRVEADEVTYNLHIMVRFEIEWDLMEGRIHVEDLPAIWNDKMQEYIGITPERDAEGVLQDVHWSFGAVGYFPTYTLGNLYAAMLYAQVKTEIANLEGEIAQGNLLPLKEWLHEKVHRWGRQWQAHELIQRITGRPLDAQPFLEALRKKMEPIYQISPPT